jgi:hypothetical protein
LVLNPKLAEFVLTFYLEQFERQKLQKLTILVAMADIATGSSMVTGICS